MFTQKQKQLITPTQKKTSAPNAFVAAAQKRSAETTTGNGAKAYNTSGNVFVDQFTSIGNYKAPRDFNLIEKDCEILWANNKMLCVLFLFYLRIISRVVNFMDNVKTSVSQKGGGLKHEPIMRMLWLHQKDKNIFWNNIGIFISVGSWKDVFVMLQYDLIYHGWKDRILDWDKFASLILAGLNDKNQSELIKKYLPQIKSNSQCKTIEAQADNLIAKWICSLLFGTKGEESGWTYKKYRRLKTSGTAHEWKKLISQGKHQLIDFNTIHGRALNILVRSNYLKNHGLEEKYQNWITKPETKDVKYTGFVHELFMKLPVALSHLSKGQQKTINKQFQTLVDKGGQSEQTSLIVVRDISGSMDSPAFGVNMSSNEVAKAIALYFSEFLHGSFANSYITFNNTATMRQWSGHSPIEKWYNPRHEHSAGSTDFLSIVRMFCYLKLQGIAESDFPQGILCISDGEFNRAVLGKTNVESAYLMLYQAGFSAEYIQNFIIVLWNIPNTFYGRSAPKFETMFDTPNCFYFSGYDASVISFLTSKVKNASELFDAAMNQEALLRIKM